MGSSGAHTCEGGLVEHQTRRIAGLSMNSCGKFDTYNTIYMLDLMCWDAVSAHLPFEILAGKIVVDVIFARYKIYSNNYGNGTGIEFSKLYNT